MFLLIRIIELIIGNIFIILWVIYLLNKNPELKLKTNFKAALLGIVWFLMKGLWIETLILIGISIYSFLIDFYFFTYVNNLFLEVSLVDKNSIEIIDIIYLILNFLTTFIFLALFFRSIYYNKYKEEL